MLKPSHMVRLDTHDTSKNLPLTLETFIGSPTCMHSIDANPSSQKKLNASDLRTLSFASYFIQPGRSFTSLPEIPPYSLPFSGTYVQFMSDNVLS